MKIEYDYEFETLCKNWEIDRIGRGCEFSPRQLPSSLIFIIGSTVRNIG